MKLINIISLLALKTGICTRVTKRRNEYDFIPYDDNTIMSQHHHHSIKKHSSLIGGMRVTNNQETFFSDRTINYSPIIKRANVGSFKYSKTPTIGNKRILKKQHALTNLNFRFIHNDNQLMDARFLNDEIRGESTHTSGCRMLYSTPEMTKRNKGHFIHVNSESYDIFPILDSVSELRVDVFEDSYFEMCC